MEDLKKLMVMLTPATIDLIREQLNVYRRDLGPDESTERAWVDLVDHHAVQILDEKSLT